MPKRLTKAQLDQFDALGYVSPVQLHDPAECAAIRERLEAFEAERPHDAAWAFDIKTNLLFDWVYRLSAHEPTLDAAEDLLGPNIFNTDTVFRIKEPGSETHYGWHQDAAWIQAKPCFIIAYVAITESTPENGGLRVVPGTHNSCLPFEVVVNEDGQARRRVARTLGVSEADAAFFSGLLVHGSGPNRSGRRRIAILTDYTAAHAKQSAGRASGQLLRGVDTWGHIAPEPVPVGCCAPSSALARRRILRAFPENPLMGPLEPGQAVAFPDEPMVS
jgi:hypothetical protein